MSDIIYRPVEKKDYPVIGEMINQAFGLYRYVSDPKVLEVFKTQYLYSCLAEATFTSAAEQDGKAVGVIMGNAKNNYNILKHLTPALKLLFYSMKAKALCMKKIDMSDYEHLHRIYSKLSSRHKGEFDGILTLFAVNEEYRGAGVGKALLSALKEYLKDRKVKRIYLYTDTTCNYGFYEHQGFERLETESMNLTKDGKPFQMDVFLYGYKVE